MNAAYELHAALLEAVKKCSERGLVNGAKWAAEALNGMESLELAHAQFASTPQKGMDFDISAERPSTPGRNSDTAYEAQEVDKYLLAKAYFDCREYLRAGHYLKGCKSYKSIFLRLYATYLAGEKQKDEDAETIMGPADNGLIANKQITAITIELEDLILMKGCNDAFLLYLYGVVLGRQKKEQDAVQALLKAVEAYPFNWGAWQELASNINGADMLSAVLPTLPDHIMTKFFMIHVSAELLQHGEALQAHLPELQSMFPRGHFLQVQRALLVYNAREYDEAAGIFEVIMTEDPYRLDQADVYSNILYVMENRAKLAHLAQAATNTDQFRPETCCIIGNYYSLRNEHEKAVTYFRRALKLNRNYLSAWTLMGHEFVEMKNTHAAIEAYRRAVDVNRKDYRAWYGLGQTYEMLEMHYYALYYFQRATSLRPYDQRMWQALAECYEQLQRPAEAIKAYKRALGGNAVAPTMLYKLGNLYERLGNVKATAAYFVELVTVERREGMEADEATAESGRARIWLAKHEMSRGNLRQAEAYVADAITLNVPEIEDARALQRELRSRRENQ
ncbi:Anaphase-promoting complex subunit 8 [Saitoella coloradoensis]